MSARLSRIALIGLRGAGKSTLGQKLAAALQYHFVELDQTIEDLSGMGRCSRGRPPQSGHSLAVVFLHISVQKLGPETWSSR